MEAGKEIACQEIKDWIDLSYPWHLLSAN